MWEFYQAYYVPFGELLTDMEREGIYVNASGHLAQVYHSIIIVLQAYVEWDSKIPKATTAL
jgi:hypothetical protein